MLTTPPTFGADGWFWSYRCATIVGMPRALAALICGWSEAGSLPASKMIALARWAMAAFMPCTHCDGWPWFCHVVTLTPIGVAMRLMWLLIVDTNGTWLDAGMMKSLLPRARCRALNAGPGATNFGTAL